MNDQLRTSLKIAALPTMAQHIIRRAGAKPFNANWIFKAREWLSYKIAPPVPTEAWVGIQLTHDSKLRVQIEPEPEPEPQFYDDDLTAWEWHDEEIEPE